LRLPQGGFCGAGLGLRAVTPQGFCRNGYFDEIAQVVSSGNSSTTALAGSTEAAQFHVTAANEPPKTVTSEAHA